MSQLATLLFWFLSVYAPPCPYDTAPIGTSCIDLHEAPNIFGAKPMVMQSALDGETWCMFSGKRLCTEREWESACKESNEPCNNDKIWKPWSRITANSDKEVQRLWQGTVSGAYPQCRTATGVYDLQGNVEEWVLSSKGRAWPYTLKGGWWAKRTACHRSNDFHEPTFRFYQTGFRCCVSRLPLVP